MSSALPPLAAVAVAAGTALGGARPGLAWVLLVMAGVALAAAAFLRPRVAAACAAALLALGCAAGASSAWRASGAERALLPGLAEREAEVRVCGTVRELRHRSIEIAVDGTVVDEATSWRVREPLRITGAHADRSSPGERICAEGELAPARPGRDEPPLLVADDVVSRGVASPVRYAASVVRERFSRAAQGALPPVQAGLLLGMTDGDVALVDDATLENFRTTGMAHLVAVSGSNVAVVLALVVILSRALITRGRWIRALVALPPLAFFAFLTGLEPSVLRAVFAAGLALAVTAEGRTTDALRVTSAAFIGLILLAPELLSHPGFQLSFGATLGLVFWARPLTDRLASVRPDSKFVLVVAACVATTVAAQIAVAPLLAWHFGRVPALGGVANLVVAPLAPVVMIGGGITLAAACVVPGLGWTPATMRLVLDFILACSKWFAGLPAASIALDVLAAAALTAGLAGLLARSARFRAAAVAIVVVCATASAGRAGAAFECAAAELRAIDVGQGTAVLLRAGGEAVLIDGGPAKGGVVGQLGDLGVRSLDAVFVSHPHADHTEGVVEAIERLHVDAVFGPVTLPWARGREVIRAARDRAVPVAFTAAGDTHRFGPDIELAVLWPEPGDAPEFDEDLIHPYSLVMRARVGDTTVILPGDIGAGVGAELADDPIGAPLLIAPHHGSKDLDQAFVAAVGPRMIVVTVGADNPYGHPAPEALATYAQHGRVFRTDQDGDVVTCLDGGTAEVWTER